MPDVTFKAHISSTHEYCNELDENGRRLPKDRQSNVCTITPLKAVTPDSRIDLSFLVWGKIAVSLCPNDSESSHRRNFVASNSVRSFFKSLARLPDFPMHGEFSVWIDKTALSFEELDPYLPLEFTAPVMPVLFDRLAEATNHRRITERAFSRAKDYLFDKLQGCLDGYESPIRRALAFVNACKRAGYDFSAPYRDFDEVERLNEGIQKLLSRSNATHPSYKKLLDRTSEAAYLLHCPTYWNAQPPSGDNLDLN